LDYRRGHLVPLWEPASVVGYRGQVAYLRKRFPNARVAVQLGSQSDVYVPWTNRRKPNEGRGGARASRPTVEPASADPENLRGWVRQINVVEAGHLKGGLKPRRIDTLYFEPGAPLCRS
jgi:hypothetical protein